MSSHCANSVLNLFLTPNRILPLLGHCQMEPCRGKNSHNYCIHPLIPIINYFPFLFVKLKIMEAYSNCRQFNCVTPIVEQSEYHMFNREKAELYLPELYNKIGVGFMAWSPISMSLSENSERLLFTTKGSLKNKSQSYLWSEDELNKEVCP